jgi:2-polyprenyl-3-methyl-5-hydroxy-6-metoxy-1,4-benzoquinol methylase
MPQTAYDKVYQFLQNNPPQTMRWQCELCDRKPLITIADKDRYGLPLKFQLCPSCGLVTLNPRWTDDRYAVFYKEYYRPLVLEYNQRFKKKKRNISYDVAVITKRVLKLIDDFQLRTLLPSRPRILEIGGGVGIAAEALRNNLSASVVIVDPNEAEAEIAAKKGFTVVNDVLENVDLESDCFDLVIMLRTVDHLVDCAVSFQKIHSLLKPDGRVLLDGVDYYKKMSTHLSAVKFLKIDHCYYFSPFTLVAMLNKHGLPSLMVDLKTSDQIVVLSERGKPESEMTELPEQIFWEGPRRYAEWEQIERRPRMSRVIRFELSHLLSWLRRRIPGQ